MALPRSTSPAHALPSAIAVGALLTLGILIAGAAGAVTPSGPSAHLVLGSDGSLVSGISVDLANGSALRYAIDGNFTPIISALPINQSQRVTLLSQIQSAEATPIVSSLFGNQDGSVESGEVTLFESLLLRQSRFLPSGSLTGTNVVSLTLDGQASTSAHVSALTFVGAEGPDRSTAPITIESTITYQFSFGSGTQTLALGPGSAVPGTGGSGAPPPVIVPSISVSVDLPAQTTIASVSGFDTSSVQNDVWGLGSSSVQGEYTPAANSSVTVQFHPSFPTAYVAVGVAVAVVAAAAAVLLLRQRRRSRAAPDEGSARAPPPGDEKVGPSGSP